MGLTKIALESLLIEAGVCSIALAGQIGTQPFFGLSDQFRVLRFQPIHLLRCFDQLPALGFVSQFEVLLHQTLEVIVTLMRRNFPLELCSDIVRQPYHE